jgi:uncharacterized Zn finger protein (UPF0148 family)
MTPTGRILTCKCCGEPLRIVCPNHGTEHVTASWPADRHAHRPERDQERYPARHVAEPKRQDAPPKTMREGTALHRTLQLVSRDPAAPTPIGAIVEAMAMPITNVGAVLTNLVHRGLVARVGRGLYVRTGAAA